MWMTDSMKKRLDSSMINRKYERLVIRLCERLIEKPYIRLSGLPDDKVARCMAGQTVSHSNVQTWITCKTMCL
jgi:hypothetical protein